MRRALASLGILGLLGGGFYLLKDKVSLAPQIGHPNEVKTSQVEARAEVPPVKAASKQNKFRKGVKHENRHWRSRSAKVQGPRPRKSERASDESIEIESFASIYQDQEAVEQRSSVDDESNSAPPPSPSSPIPGVKVAAWVSAQKNRVPEEVPDPNVGTGMRYFLNCLELKNKGILPLEAKDCDALITDRRFKN